MRFIDKEKKLNFFLKSENSKKADNYLIFKDKLDKNITHKSHLMNTISYSDINVS